MDERQRQFAQFASALNQFAAGNAPGAIDRSHRDRSTNDGRSSTGSTSSGSSSIVSNNGNNIAAAVAAGGNAAVWGELNRALQYGYPFGSGATWPPTQGTPTDFHRLGGNFGNYGDSGSDARNQGGRSEGRRVPSKGETKATPPLPPGLGPARGSTLASLQQLVNLPNEEVYRLIAAQQYAAAFSAIPPSSRPQLSPGPNPSHTSISPGQIHPGANVSSRHQNVDPSNQYGQQYMLQQRYRQPNRNVSPLSNASSVADRPQASPSPDNVSINGDYSESVRREDRLSPHANKRRELMAHTGQIRVSPNLMPTKVPLSREGLSVQNESLYQYDNDAPMSGPNSRVSDGQPSGSESEGDQKSRHRRKQHLPRRQTVIYGGLIQPRQDLQMTTNSVDSSSDDSQECDLLMGAELANQSDIPSALSTSSDHHNPITSMSSAMSHALSHPFLAPHLNPPDRKFDNPASTPIDNVENPERKSVNSDPTNPPNINDSGIQIVSDLTQSLGKNSSAMRIPDLIPCDPLNIELDAASSDKSVRNKKTNCASDDYCTPVKKRKLSQPSTEQDEIDKSENYSGTFTELANHQSEAMPDTHLQPDGGISISCDTVQTNDDQYKVESLGIQGVVPKSEAATEGLKVNSNDKVARKSEDAKLVNGDHELKEEIISPTKLSDLSDDYYDCGKRRTRQKRPISYVEDETDPVQETNEEAIPLYSPTRRRGRRSKEKADSSLSPDISFPSITIRDASLYEPSDFGGGRKLQDIPEYVKEPLHIDTNVSQESLSPDIYDFNDTDNECPERKQRKRGRKRGSPRKTQYPLEFVRSSPRKESIRSPKFFPSIKILDKKESGPDNDADFCGDVSQAENYSISPISKNDRSLHANVPQMEQHNNNYGKKMYETYSTISPTKLASLCQEPMDTYSRNTFHSNGPYRDLYEERDYESNELDVNACNNNRGKKRSKKRKRGRPKGSKSSPKKNSFVDAQPLDTLMMAGKDSLCNIPIDEQMVNVSMAQFPSPRSGGRGRRKKRTSKNNFSPTKSPRNNVNSSNGPSPKEKGRYTQNSMSSLPDISEAASLAMAKLENNLSHDIKENKPKTQKVKQDCEGETMEDIEQFLKETAPSSDSTPLKSETSNSTMTTTPNTSHLSTPSTSENAYRESRPKRISRPPPELPEGEMNDLLLLLNMDDDESEDEDYVPIATPDHGSDSRLSLTDDDSDISPDSPSPTKGELLDERKNETKLKVDKKIGKGKKSGKKIESKKKEELKKKSEEKLDRRGPYVRLNSKGCRDIIVNTDGYDDDKERNPRKLAVPFHVDKEVKNVKVGFNSTLHPNYNAFTKDMTWYCAFCKMYSHHCAMGDLFGPYFINSSSPSKKNYPTVTEGQVEETISSPEEVASRSSIRRTPRSDGLEFDSRKSEVWESPPMRFVPSATPARMLGRGGILRTPERGNLNSPRLMPGATAAVTVGPNPRKGLTTPVENKRPPGTECWIHSACLLWSSGVTVVNSKMLGMDEAVNSAQDSVCNHCKESGATVCCLWRGCNLTVHVPCARFLRWSLNYENFLSHCPLHLPSKTTSAN